MEDFGRFGGQAGNAPNGQRGGALTKRTKVVAFLRIAGCGGEATSQNNLLQLLEAFGLPGGQRKTLQAARGRCFDQMAPTPYLRSIHGPITLLCTTCMSEKEEEERSFPPVPLYGYKDFTPLTWRVDGLISCTEYGVQWKGKGAGTLGRQTVGSCGPRRIHRHRRTNPSSS